MSPLESWAVVIYWVGFFVTVVAYPRVAEVPNWWRWTLSVLLWPIFWGLYLVNLAETD